MNARFAKPALSVEDVGPRLFQLLRQMDAEATTPMASGVATGLCDFGRHARPDLQRPQNEVEWSRRLAELLMKDGVETEAERRYSTLVRKRRDLYLTLAADRKMSIEIKGAWSDYWGRNHLIYRSYLLHPLLSGLDRTKTHTVPYDLQRLATLRPPETDYIGQLLIGFEQIDDPMDSDVALLIELAKLTQWQGQNDSWISKTSPDQRIQIWFWWRPADGQWSLPMIGA